MKLEFVVKGTEKFIEKELLCSLAGAKKWVAEFGVGVVRNNANVLVENLLKQPYLTTLGIVDDEGDIDVATLIGCAKATTKSQGALEFTIPFIGTFKLGSDAFDSLGVYINESAQGK